MESNPPQRTPALFIGIDWSDNKHDVYVIDREGKGTLGQIQHTAEAIDTWVNQQLERAGGDPIAIILEQSRGALMHALMSRENVILYPVNPKQFASYRDSYSNAGCKDDPSDARLLARMLRERITLLRPWVPDDEATRMISRLCQVRRSLVQERMRAIQQLTDQLKAYFPLVLRLFAGKSSLMLSLLQRWPDPRDMRRADKRLLVKIFNEHSLRNSEQQQERIDQIRNATLLTTDDAVIVPAADLVKFLAKQIPLLDKTIGELEAKIDEAMKAHPDAPLFTTLPGAGKALAPRLLAAFGSQRDRYANAGELATFSGIAPVTKQSGKTRIVHQRFACSKYLRQTFHEFADHARKWCPWSGAYYRLQRSRGMKHHATLRKLAYRWIRILFVVWKTRTAYDPATYLATITRKNPDIMPFLQPSENA